MFLNQKVFFQTYTLNTELESFSIDTVIVLINKQDLGPDNSHYFTRHAKWCISDPPTLTFSVLLSEVDP